MKKLGSQIVTSLRVVIVTWLVCSGLYTLAVLAIGQLFVPETANGSVVRDERGETIGSRLIAQKFTRPEYFWPRPSAVDYNAASAGGSNLSPTNPALRERAQQTLAAYHADSAFPIPADLVTASGSGLDPDITEQAALFQADRIAAARHVDRTSVEGIIEANAARPGGIFTNERQVNVLAVNMDLDRMNRH